MASCLAHPSCTVGADLEGKDQGSDCEEMQRSNTPKKRASHQSDGPSEGCTTASNHWGSHAATLAASHAPTTFGISRLPPCPPLRPSRASASKEALRSLEKPGLARPERNQPVVSRGKDAKNSPFGTRVILLPVETFPTQPPACRQTDVVLLLSEPQAQQWQSSASSRAKRGSS